MISTMERRQFLCASAAAMLVAGSTRLSGADNRRGTPVFSTTNRRWQQAYDQALQVLADNVQVLPHYDLPVLIEGASYTGIWQECGPHESLVYSPFRPDVARNSHMTFFALQKKDGQMPGMPRLCPDLSATVYGARVALAAMARALGKNADADRWTESAEQIRKLILAKLFVPDDAAFYDLDAQGHFVRVHSDVLSRVCGEHVVDQKTFDSLWERQIHNPEAFWAPYPLPSIALDDPAFVRPIPRNSWGGATQALTALRTPRWFEYYSKAAELSFLMSRWCDAILRDMTFRQQMDPITGEFTQADLPRYSPCALVMVDFTWRLAGVRETDNQLEWNVRPHCPASEAAHFFTHFDRNRTASMVYDKKGAELELDGKSIGRIESGTARLITDKQGRPKLLAGISETIEAVSLQLGSHPAQRITIRPNQQLHIG